MVAGSAGTPATHSSEIVRAAQSETVLQIRSGGKARYLTSQDQTVGLLEGLDLTMRLRSVGGEVLRRGLPGLPALDRAAGADVSFLGGATFQVRVPPG